MTRSVLLSRVCVFPRLRNDRYYLLESIEDAPQLPAGYPAMMLLSLVPSMWFSTMDDRLDEWNGANRE